VTEKPVPAAGEEENTRGDPMLIRLLLTMILATAPAFAQRGGGSRSGPESSISGVPLGTTRLDSITEVLHLNKDQKKFVKTTLDDAQKVATPVCEQIVKSHEAIGKAVQAGRGQDEIKGLIGVNSALAAQLARIELEAFAKIFVKLDETQQNNARLLFQMMKGLFNEKNWNAAQ
jgi:hypothetical protein